VNLKFWKKKPKAGENADTTADDKTVAMEVPELDTSAKAGLLSRVKSGLTGLARRFRKHPTPEAGNDEDQTPNAHDNTAAESSDAPALRSIRTKKRLIIGGAIGLLILLLTGVGFAAWKIFLSPPQQDASAPAKADASHNNPPLEHAATKPAETPQDEIEALRKKNDELQAQIEALKKEPPQDQHPASPTGSAAENTASPSSTGEMTISNKDPKAAAQALKEAIEAMNAGSGTPASKPVK
jgi:hypothetical protein